jgi:hypothetical protein
VAGTRPRGRGIGYDFLHVAVDDNTRLTYVEARADERDATSAWCLPTRQYSFTDIAAAAQMAEVVGEGAPRRAGSCSCTRASGHRTTSRPPCEAELSKVLETKYEARSPQTQGYYGPEISRATVRDAHTPTTALLPPRGPPGRCGCTASPLVAGYRGWSLAGGSGRSAGVIDGSIAG